MRVLCTRECRTPSSNPSTNCCPTKSNQLGLSHFTKYKDDNQRRERFAVYFEGLRHNINSIKSMEGVDVCWVEEAEKVTDDSWRILIPTIRAPGSEIWVTFNPHLETDPTYQRFIANPRQTASSNAVNWSDNPWFPCRTGERAPTRRGIRQQRPVPAYMGRSLPARARWRRLRRRNAQDARGRSHWPRTL